MKPLTQKFLNDWFDDVIQDLDQESVDVIEFLVDNFVKFDNNKKSYYKARGDYLDAKYNLDSKIETMKLENDIKLEILKTNTITDTRNEMTEQIAKEIIADQKNVIVISTTTPDFTGKSMRELKQDLKSSFNKEFKKYLKMKKRHDLDEEQPALLPLTSGITLGEEWNDYAEYKQDLLNDR